MSDASYYAYALGYYQGRQEGVLDMPESLPEEQRLRWKQGYDRGVTDYCYEQHGDES